MQSTNSSDLIRILFFNTILSGFFIDSDLLFILAVIALNSWLSLSLISQNDLGQLVL